MSSEGAFLCMIWKKLSFANFALMGQTMSNSQILMVEPLKFSHLVMPFQYTSKEISLDVAFHKENTTQDSKKQSRFTSWGLGKHQCTKGVQFWLPISFFSCLFLLFAVLAPPAGHQELIPHTKSLLWCWSPSELSRSQVPQTRPLISPSLSWRKRWRRNPGLGM